MDRRLEPLTVVAALIERDGLVLITRRPNGRWEFPGGKREPGESLTEALKREIMEELGLEIEPGPELAVVDHDYPDLTVRLHLFHCTQVAGEPRAAGGQTLAWVEADDFGNFDFLEADIRLIDCLGEG